MSLLANSTLPLQKEKTNKTMPYVSDAQRGYVNANRNKLEKQGVDVNEWNKSSAGKKLPARAPKRKTFGQRIGAKD